VVLKPAPQEFPVQVPILLMASIKRMENTKDAQNTQNNVYGKERKGHLLYTDIGGVDG